MTEKDISWGTVHFHRLAGNGEESEADSAAGAQASTR